MIIFSQVSSIKQDNVQSLSQNYYLPSSQIKPLQGNTRPDHLVWVYFAIMTAHFPIHIYNEMTEFEKNIPSHCMFSYIVLMHPIYRKTN